MFSKSDKDRLLKAIPKNDLYSVKQLLAVKLEGPGAVESAALLDLVSDNYEGLDVSYLMGDEDADGVEKDTVEIIQEATGAVLLELAVFQDDRIEVADSADLDMVFWNSSKEIVIVDDSEIEPGDYSLSVNLTDGEKDQVLQKRFLNGGDTPC